MYVIHLNNYINRNIKLCYFQNFNLLKNSNSFAIQDQDIHQCIHYLILFSVDLYNHPKTNRKVAIKKLSVKNLTQSECRKTYENEISILTKLKGCPNVVELLGYGFYTTIDNSTRRTRNLNNYFIIMEHIEA